MISTPSPRTFASFASAVGALAVTAVLGWSFVHTTSIERLRVGAVAAPLSAAFDFAGAVANGIAPWVSGSR
jgi:hypothetical protein